MGINLLYDTNVFIYHLNNTLTNKNLFDADYIYENNIYLSNITRIELLSFPQLTKQEEKIINQFIDEFQVIPLIREIEDISIKIRKESKIRIPDAVIIATAKFMNAKIVTADEVIVNYCKKKDIINPLS